MRLVDRSPGNGTRYELVVGVEDGRLLVAWPEMRVSAWFPLYDCVPSYVQTTLGVGFADGVAIRNVLIELGYWEE